MSDSEITTFVEQDTGKFRKNKNDKFYTHPIIAKLCIKKIIDTIPSSANYIWMEPSAGNGAFLHNIPAGYERIGIDIEPDANDILQQNFLEWTPPNSSKKIIVFGNPPFGRQSSLAKSFISKSCKFASFIAFILPKSFTKPSMNNAFDLKFHCIFQEELGKNSFLLNNCPYNVPCIFQIWEKRDTDREIPDKVTPNGYIYVKHNNTYDIAFRRVGALAGKCYKCNSEITYCKQSHYFLKFNAELLAQINNIIEKINKHVFPSNTVGSRSLSKSEVNEVINDIIHSLVE